MKTVHYEVSGLSGVTDKFFVDKFHSHLLNWYVSSCLRDRYLKTWIHKQTLLMWPHLKNIKVRKYFFVIWVNWPFKTTQTESTAC